jgi:catechol 2,3-dioxygenase-like lactoylglutathione lyase family enzyme
MSNIRRLEHVGIGAAPDKYAQTIQFYERVFGWHRIKEHPGEITFIGDGAGGRLEILANTAPPLALPHHLAFAVDLDEFEGTMEALRAAGAQLQKPLTNPFGDRLAFFTDPAGNVAQIVGRLKHLAP